MTMIDIDQLIRDTDNKLVQLYAERDHNKSVLEAKKIAAIEIEAQIRVFQKFKDEVLKECRVGPVAPG